MGLEERIRTQPWQRAGDIATDSFEYPWGGMIRSYEEHHGLGWRWLEPPRRMVRVGLTLEMPTSAPVLAQDA